MTEDEFDAELERLRHATESAWRETQPPPPPVVYHYTSAAGMQGIVTSRRLRASITSELKDIGELIHASEVLRSVLNRHAAAATSLERAGLYPPQLIESDFARADITTAYVASLSAAEDNLSQWGLYADNFRGLALGFDSSALAALDEADHLKQNIGFANVVYDTAKQRQFFEWLVTEWERTASAAIVKRGGKVVNPAWYLASWFGILTTCVISVLPNFKSTHFASEREWRLGHLHRTTAPDCQVLTGDSYKTHVELDLTQLSGRLPLVSIWLGPACATHESKVRLQRYLSEHGYEDVLVEQSRIPLRIGRTNIEL